MRDGYVEIIGQVVDSSTLKMLTSMNLGDNLGKSIGLNRGVWLNQGWHLDMQVVNHTIELMHTPIMAPYWGTKP